MSTQSQRTQQKSPDISLLDPALQKQWDHAANARLGSIVIKPMSNKKAWWMCDKCPNGHRHSWCALVFSRTDGNGCPQCSSRKVCQHNSLATKAPEVAAQWDYEKNDDTPDSVVAMSRQSLRWLCAEQQSLIGSAETLAARSALSMQGGRRLSIQPLQNARTLK